MSLLSSRPSETLYFQNEAGQLFYQGAAGVVRLVWSAERTALATIQDFYEQALLLLQRTHSTKILSYHGQRAPLSGPAQEWLTSSWIPRAISQAGARHCAIVEGANPLHRLSTQSVVATSPTGLVFRRFAALEEADTWLAQLAKSRGARFSGRGRVARTL